MQKAFTILVSLLLASAAVAASAQSQHFDVGLRYSVQRSNGPVGTCNCFWLQGGSGDFYGEIASLHRGEKFDLQMGLVADFGAEDVENIENTKHGLTETTFTGGPRFVFDLHKPNAPVKASVFGQALLGGVHASGQLLSGTTIVDSATSYAVAVGGGADLMLSHHFALRMIQADFLRTRLPNGSNNWQNNLRIGAGLAMRF